MSVSRYLHIICMSFVLLLSLPVVARGQTSGRGQVIILTKPSGLAVSVDGKSVGTSPVTVKDLLPGQHFVEVLGPKGSKANQIIQVKAGESKVVTITVAVASATSPPPVPQPVIEPGAGPRPRRAVPPRRVSVPEPRPKTSPPPRPILRPAGPTARPLNPTEPLAVNAPPSDRLHHEKKLIRSQGFPGLVYPFNIGISMDALITLWSEEKTKSTATGRLRIQGSPTRWLSMGVDVLMSNKAVGPSISFNLPYYIPFGIMSRFAMLFRMTLYVYQAQKLGTNNLEGLITGGDVEVRFAVAVHRNIVISADAGMFVLGLWSDNSAYASGVYIGLFLGGGIRWIF